MGIFGPKNCKDAKNELSDAKYFERAFKSGPGTMKAAEVHPLLGVAVGGAQLARHLYKRHQAKKFLEDHCDIDD